MSMERLHKFLAHCGVASRRKAEEIILEGRVAINGEIVAELGVKVDPGTDFITVDGKTVHEENKVYLLMHKPKGYTTTAEDEYGRSTVLDLVPSEITQRVYPAGRLDRDSEGLIVLTNDGDLSFYLTHPSQGVRKVYEVTVEGRIEDAKISELLAKGVRIGPVLVKPSFCKISRRSKERTTLKIGVSEGVNREVRRLFAILGHEVKRLIRLEVGPFSLKGISKGKCRRLTREELTRVFELMEHPSAAKLEKLGQLKRNYSGTKLSGKPDPARPKRYSGGSKLKQRQGSTQSKFGTEERSARGKRPKRGERSSKTAVTSFNQTPRKKVAKKPVKKTMRKKPTSGRKHPLA